MPAPKAPKPTCKALLLCDQTILEAGTGKMSLIGVFQHFGLSAIPGRTKEFHAFVQMTNAKGTYDMVVEVRRLSDDKVIARASGVGIEIRDRHQVFSIVIPAPPIDVVQEGSFDFIVFANDEEIDRQQFKALLL